MTRIFQIHAPKIRMPIPFSQKLSLVGLTPT
jgi:hypothetical protein